MSERFCRGFVTEAKQACSHLPRQEVERVYNGLVSVACDPVDAAIAVSMVGDIVVLSPRGRLDIDATYALVQAVDAASCSDRKVVIDLDGSAELSPAELLFRTEATPPNGVPLPVTRPTIGVIAPGCVRLSSTRGYWTIDLGERRFCRSAEPVDRRFVGIADWIGIRNVWAASVGVAVLTNDDAIISTATPWVAAMRAA
jgi:hypothetical protein